MKTTKEIIFDLIFWFSEYNEFGAKTHTLRSNIVKACRAYGFKAQEVDETLKELIASGAIERIEIKVDEVEYAVSAYKQLVQTL